MNPNDGKSCKFIKNAVTSAMLSDELFNPWNSVPELGRYLGFQTDTQTTTTGRLPPA